MNHQTTSLRLNQPLPCHAVLNSSDRKSRLRLIPSPFSEALKSRDYSLLSPWMERSSPDTRTTPPQLRSGNADGRGNYVAIVPPYWQHHRAGSYASVGDGKPPPIRLEDHTEEPSEQSGALWAKSVTILDYVIVSGSKTGVGAYVVWNCKVETLDGGPITIRKRYSEFNDLREKLLMTFPRSEAAMPPLPPKSVLYKFRPRFLEKRRAGLAYFLNCILLNPEFSGSPVLKDFLFS